MLRTKWTTGAADLGDAHMIRRVVFMEEQGVSEAEEMDGTDAGAIHLVVYDGYEPVATGRILIEDDKYILGRVAVLKEHRGEHLGDFVMRLLVRRAFELGGERQEIHAQLQAKGFYEKLGFVAYGEEFMEADIPHTMMERFGDIAGPCGL